ncbi:hypothetical protein WKI65_15810 [Streptomyces sp. MS1.AVA.3]|uniref:Uncharacterized protein n=1 Tax=Streptomyces decoyicus TaxID=249567 RepID=A0ABZ1FIH7_9ACTN|nr:hypothetical protein [Streptomyces decoyicus]QZY17252.1 hypothetical protein K7C20_19990 [Streptomyces decoyicus]WSB69951.1 hypothetical protein OG863_19460 [Streptomyces decoyicus]
MSTTAGVWNGVALETDPRIGEFQADPAAYMKQHAGAWRSGDLAQEQARILKQKNQSLRLALRTLLGRLSSK